MAKTKKICKLSDKLSYAVLRLRMGIFNEIDALHRAFRSKSAKLIALSPVMFAALTLPVYADGTDPNQVISSILDLLKKWIPIMGGLVVIVGAIQLGVSFKDDNADGKTRGIQTMIGGAIITAIASLISLSAG